MGLTTNNTEPQTQPETLTVEDALKAAVTHHQAGKLQEAERLYRAILRAQPNAADANHNLGVLAVQMKLPAAGLPHFRVALEANPSKEQYWLSYVDALIRAGQNDTAREVLAHAQQRGLRGVVVDTLAGRLGSPPTQELDRLFALCKQGQYSEAETLALSLTEHFPKEGYAWKILGDILWKQGKDALLALQTATKILPDDAEAHHMLGKIFQDIGQINAAVASYRIALKINPENYAVSNDLACSLRDIGQLDEAQAWFERACALNVDNAEAHNNLGKMMARLGCLVEAQACFERACALNVDNAEAHNNLGTMLASQGQLEEAKACYGRALMLALNNASQSREIGRTQGAKVAFVNSVTHLIFGNSPASVRNTLVRSLSEPWCRPAELVSTACALVKLAPDVGECVARAAEAWPLWLPVGDLYGPSGIATVAADTLLCALLKSAPICDVDLEWFLTMARRDMLEVATEMTASTGEIDTDLGFYSALAHQCFINEYVFSCTNEEIQKANNIRDSLAAALKADIRAPSLWLVAVGAYFPLSQIPLACRLLDWQWPDEVAALLVQQIREPEEELQLRSTIPRLTEFEGEVSALVQNQYEENPYPRWIRMAYIKKPLTIDGVLRQRFPLSTFRPLSKDNCLDVLIAGCGTGQHPIQTACRFRGAKVLAIDLSMSSLCYAKRKTRELGLTSIEYAQADLLMLGSLGRSFDVIEALGVLHHLADPFAGWQVLLSLLRPGGVMMLGFYSEVARRDIVKVRAFIAEKGYAASASEIRQFRQDILLLAESSDFGMATKSADFFSISSCRDLLFHVQEHRMTLTSIDSFLRDNNLAFLGFEVKDDVLQTYMRRFPDDRAATNLNNWQIFENENPDIFFGMYQFWVQKN